MRSGRRRRRAKRNRQRAAANRRRLVAVGVAGEVTRHMAQTRAKDAVMPEPMHTVLDRATPDSCAVAVSGEGDTAMRWFAHSGEW